MEIIDCKNGLCRPTKNNTSPQENNNNLREIITILPDQTISCRLECPICPPRNADFRRVEMLP